MNAVISIDIYLNAFAPGQSDIVRSEKVSVHHEPNHFRICTVCDTDQESEK